MRESTNQIWIKLTNVVTQQLQLWKETTERRTVWPKTNEQVLKGKLHSVKSRQSLSQLWQIHHQPLLKLQKNPNYLNCKSKTTVKQTNPKTEYHWRETACLLSIVQKKDNSPFTQILVKNEFKSCSPVNLSRKNWITAVTSICPKD